MSAHIDDVRAIDGPNQKVWAMAQYFQNMKNALGQWQAYKIGPPTNWWVGIASRTSSPSAWIEQSPTPRFAVLSPYWGQRVALPNISVKYNAWIDFYWEPVKTGAPWRHTAGWVSGNCNYPYPR